LKNGEEFEAEKNKEKKRKKRKKPLPPFQIDLRNMAKLILLFGKRNFQNGSEFLCQKRYQK